MSSQITDRVLMIEPRCFGLNPESVSDNFFQPRESGDTKAAALVTAAMNEFSVTSSALESAGISVSIVTPDEAAFTPDAVFPNNWFSTHDDSRLCLYPMKHPNRRQERRPEIIQRLRQCYSAVLDLSGFENRGLFLESTGSMVLDRINKLCYAALSQRTSRELVELWCRELGFTPVLFAGADLEGHPIYHTNVFLSIGKRFAVVCLDAVSDLAAREQLKQMLQDTGKTIIPISQQQVYHYCGNCLELRGANNSVIAMSTQAWSHFTPEQQALLEAHAQIVTADVGTIERVGGGSVRCMIAELF